MKYNSIGEQLVAKAKELDPSYKPDKFNDMSEALDVILNNSGGDEYVDLVFDFEQFTNVWDQNTWDLRIPANTITEDMLSPIVQGKKKGLLLKIRAPELGEEGEELFYATIPFYCDFATGALFTNVTSILGRIGCWVGSVDEIDQNQVCKFNSTEGKVFYHPTIKDGKISQAEYDLISSLAKSDKLAGITVDISEIATFAFSFMGINHGNTFVFGSTTVGTETDVYTKKSIDYITYTIKSDLSCKLDWKTNYFVEISSGINERVIPTITQGHQENLSIGNGLEIKYGALQTTGPLFDMFPYYDTNTQTISQEIFELLMQKIYSNEIVGISLGEARPCMLLDDIASGGISFIGPYQGSSGRFKATFNTDLSVKMEYINEGGSSTNLTLPQTASSSQVIPSITTTNKQQNLTIGDGLKIENGVLKTNNIPELPSDASTKTYVLKSINGVLTWSE